MAEVTENDNCVLNMLEALVQHEKLNHFCTSMLSRALSTVGRLHAHQAFASIPDERGEDTRIPSP